MKRLKALKLKDLRVKLERIGREGGRSLEESKGERRNVDQEHSWQLILFYVALQDLDLEGDWDPDAHDRQMADIYAEEEGIGADDEKPQWDDDIDITDIVGVEEEEVESRGDKKKKKKKKRKDVDGDGSGVDINEMDADMAGRGEDDEEWDGTEEMRKRKLDEYMDELYGMEFNDMVSTAKHAMELLLIRDERRLVEYQQDSNTRLFRNRTTRSLLSRYFLRPILS